MPSIVFCYLLVCGVFKVLSSFPDDSLTAGEQVVNHLFTTAGGKPRSERATKDSGSTDVHRDSDDWANVLDHLSKFELIAIGLGLCCFAVITSCVVVCLCKRKRRSNKDVKVDDNQNQEVAENGKDEEEKAEKTKLPDEPHPKLQMSVHPSRQGSRRRRNPSGDYDKIVDNPMTPIDPQRLNDITSSGYVKMVHTQQNDNSDEQNGETKLSDVLSAPALPAKRRKSSSRFHRISTLLLGRRTGSDQNDYTNMDARGSPLKSLKSMESFHRKGKRKFVKINKGQWLQDSGLWSDI